MRGLRQGILDDRAHFIGRRIEENSRMRISESAMSSPKLTPARSVRSAIHLCSLCSNETHRSWAASTGRGRLATTAKCEGHCALSEFSREERAHIARYCMRLDDRLASIKADSDLLADDTFPEGRLSRFT
jgi:hypothetical protein